MGLLIYTKSIFFLLVELCPLVGPYTDLNWIKNKSYGKNSNLSDRMNISNQVDNEIALADELPYNN